MCWENTLYFGDNLRWWEGAVQRMDEAEKPDERTGNSESQGTSSTRRDDEDSAISADSDTASMFESEAHRLAWLIYEIEKRVSDASIEPPDVHSGELFRVTSSWLETALTQSTTILALLHQGLHAGTGPLHRALWELWIDWRYLLRVGDSRLNATKVLLNAQIEALEYFEKLASAFDPIALTRLRNSIRKFELEHPQASVEVRAQRKEHRFHWSGLSHSKMERELKPQYPSLYKPFSWEAHAVMGPIRDVRIARQGDTISIQFGQEEENALLNAHFLPYSSGGALFYMYNEHADMWGLRPLVLPGFEAASPDET